MRPILKLSRPINKFRLMDISWTAQCNKRSRELRNQRIWWWMEPVYDNKLCDAPPLIEE